MTDYDTSYAAIYEPVGDFFFYSITDEEAALVKAHYEDKMNIPHPKLQLTPDKIVDCEFDDIFDNRDAFCELVTTGKLWTGKNK